MGSFISTPQADPHASAPPSSSNNDNVPDHFICPITDEPMRYPFVTSAGISYEYFAIAKWLETNNTDPKTNLVLKSTALIPNHNLRGQIETWFEENDREEEFKNSAVPRPPPHAYEVKTEGLDQILRYKNKNKGKGGAGVRQKANNNNNKTATLPPAFEAFKHSYTFHHGDKKGVVTIVCDNNLQTALKMPRKAVFATPMGLVFYDPKEYHDVRVPYGAYDGTPCRYKATCNQSNCKFAHPFVCAAGTTCANLRSCKFLHPPPESVKPISKAHAECRYGVTCTRANCHFAHSKGRMSLPPEQARISVTHSLTLERLATPVQLALKFPPRATEFQVQGEFVCCFQPFPGTWAKKHFSAVTVFRFDPSAREYTRINEYSLSGHYCNCAIVAGRYMVFSFWPYEEEAMRTIWDCHRVTLMLTKALKNSSDDCEHLRVENSKLQANNSQLQANNSQLQVSNSQLQVSNSQLQASNSQLLASNSQLQANNSNLEYQARMLNQRLEAERNERLRLRDPIHIYALEEGRSGANAGDWRMVLDYHKGANDIDLGEPQADGTQRLDFTVGDSVLTFDLVVPSNINGIKAKLPVCPKVLCPDF